MSEYSWWMTALQWTLWVVLMTITMGWLGRSRLKRRPEIDATKLVHPLSSLIMGGVAFAFFASIAVISNVYANETTTWWTTAIFFGFALMSAFMIWSYFFDKHEVSDEGLEYSTLLGYRKNIRWDDVESIRYKPLLKWFLVKCQSGETARLSAMLMGLPAFARLALDKAPRRSLDPDTKGVLEATAEGDPPPVW